MPAEHAPRESLPLDRGQSREPNPLVTDESLVLRNYDGRDAHEVTVRLVDVTGEPVFERAYTLAPMETVSVETRLRRAVYRVEACLDGDRTESADCLIGSGLTETAVVETGNGVLSVVEGLV